MEELHYLPAVGQGAMRRSWCAGLGSGVAALLGHGWPQAHPMTTGIGSNPPAALSCIENGWTVLLLFFSVCLPTGHLFQVIAAGCLILSCFSYTFIVVVMFSSFVSLSPFLFALFSSYLCQVRHEIKFDKKNSNLVCKHHGQL